MRSLYVLCVVSLWITTATFAQVGINTDNSAPHPSAGLDVKFTDKGFVPPRMTFAQRNDITDPVDGLIVFCTNCEDDGSGAICIFYGGKWYNFSLNCKSPNAPLEGSHIPATVQITWNWSAVPIAAGYKWNTVNDVGSAIDMGTATSRLETGLICNTSYNRYVWAYNDCGISAPETLFQTTSPCVFLPTIETAAISNIGLTTATGGGNVTSDGGGTISSRGVCWSTFPLPTIADSHTDNGTGTGVFVSNITGLAPITGYYVRAYATNSAGTAYGNQVVFATLNPAIGQAYGGGIIFWVHPIGNHGLIASTSDQSTGAPWGCYGTSIAGTSTLMETGQANTTLILGGCTTAGIAARICDELVLNGYDDWFLPSYDELFEMFIQRAVIGGFDTGSYYSSSEYDANTAHAVYFPTGSPVYGSKSSNRNVRAIRSF